MLNQTLFTDLIESYLSREEIIITTAYTATPLNASSLPAFKPGLDKAESALDALYSFNDSYQSQGIFPIFGALVSDVF